MKERIRTKLFLTSLATDKHNQMKQSEKHQRLVDSCQSNLVLFLILFGGEVARDVIAYQTKVSEKSWSERRKRNTFAQ